MIGLPLSERSGRIVEMLGRFRFLTTGQIQEFLFLDGTAKPESQKRVVKRLLKSLRDSGTIDRTPRLVGGEGGGSTGHVYFVKKGRVPKVAFLIRHSLVVADVALGFEKAARKHDKQRLLTFETDWHFGKFTPDAFFIYEAANVEMHAFLEVEMGTHSSRAFQTKIDRYAALYRSDKWKHGLELWPLVLVVTVSATQRNLLRRATEALRLPRPMQFRFAAIEDVRRDPLGAIWQTAGHGEQFFPLLKEKDGET